MKKISKIKLFSNNTLKAKETLKIIEKKLIANNFFIVDEGYDLAIAIGGDGSFLRMVKENNFNSDIYYIGINAGTLGFAQEVNIEDIDDFIKELKNDDFKIDKIGIQETEIKNNDGVSKFYSLNEIVIREKDLNTVFLNIMIEDVFLEKFVGDGILITTSFGSTAYNLSFGGSIIYNTFHTLQITPVAPLNNKTYRSLINSVVIPDEKIIKIVPNSDKNNLLITIDGENKIYNDVVEIKTYVNKKRIKFLRRKDYDFSKKINEKFLK